MVEIKRVIERLSVVVALSLMLSPSMLHAASESDSLLAQIKSIEMQEDSLRSVVVDYRDDFAEGDNSKAKEIEALELKIFDLLRRREALQSRVKSVSRESSSSKEVAAESIATIANSQAIANRLTRDDLSTLRRADRSDREAATLYNKYIEQYQYQKSLQQLYAQTQSEQESIKIRVEFDALTPKTDSLLEELRRLWGAAYDDKLYIYALLLEGLGETTRLNDGEAMIREQLSPISTLAAAERDELSIATEYGYQKRALVRYEESVAEALALVEARDSLRRVSKSLSVADVVEVERLEIKVRNFIEYDPIKFSSAPRYSTKSPIPEAKVYPQGRIYRIQLGAYKSKQLPSLFRGAYPICYDRTFGFWTYYLGGFATMVEAEAAVAQCRKAGFKRPEVVVWSGGERRNLAREPLPVTKGFRVVLSNVESIPSNLSTIVERLCGRGVDI